MPDRPILRFSECGIRLDEKPLRLSRGRRALLRALAERNGILSYGSAIRALNSGSEDYEVARVQVSLIRCALKHAGATSNMILNRFGSGYVLDRDVVDVVFDRDPVVLSDSTVRDLKRLLSECAVRPATAELAERVRQGVFG